MESALQVRAPGGLAAWARPSACPHRRGRWLRWMLGSSFGMLLGTGCAAGHDVGVRWARSKASCQKMASSSLHMGDVPKKRETRGSSPQRVRGAMRTGATRLRRTSTSRVTSPAKRKTAAEGQKGSAEANQALRNLEGEDVWDTVAPSAPRPSSAKGCCKRCWKGPLQFWPKQTCSNATGTGADGRERNQLGWPS